MSRDAAPDEDDPYNALMAGFWRVVAADAHRGCPLTLAWLDGDAFARLARLSFPSHDPPTVRTWLTQEDAPAW